MVLLGVCGSQLVPARGSSRCISLPDSVQCCQGGSLRLAAVGAFPPQTLAGATVSPEPVVRPSPASLFSYCRATPTQEVTEDGSALKQAVGLDLSLEMTSAVMAELPPRGGGGEKGREAV